MGKRSRDEDSSSDEEDLKTKKSKKSKKEAKDKDKKKSKKKKKDKKDKKKSKDKEKKKKKSKESSSDSDSANSDASDDFFVPPSASLVKSSKKHMTPAPKQEKPVKLEGAAKEEAISLLGQMLTKCTDAASQEALHFMIFKLDKDEILIMDSIPDEFIVKKMKQLCKLTGFQKVRDEGEKGYKRNPTTALLLPLFDKASKQVEKQRKKDEKENKQLEKQKKEDKKRKKAEEEEKRRKKDEEEEERRRKEEEKRRKEEEERGRCAGPAMPSSDWLASKKAEEESAEPAKRQQGPYIPTAAEREQAIEEAKAREEEEAKEAKENYGPVLPNQMNADELQAQKDLAESRELSHILKRQQKELDEKTNNREAWMMDLPPELRMTGEDAMTNRKFQTRSKKPRGDTSDWTDTPAQREQRMLEKMMKKAEMEAREKADAMLHTPVERQDINASAAAAQAAVDRMQGGTQEEKEPETEQQMMKRLKREFKEAKRRKKAERKERKAALKEIEWQSWDRDKVMGLRAIKSDKQVQQELKGANDLMMNFDDGGIKKAFG